MSAHLVGTDEVVDAFGPIVGLVHCIVLHSHLRGNARLTLELSLPANDFDTQIVLQQRCADNRLANRPVDPVTYYLRQGNAVHAVLRLGHDLRGAQLDTGYATQRTT